MGSGYADQLVNGYSDALAAKASEAASQAIASVLKVLGPDTEPVFAVIGPAYNRMLAIAMLLIGAFIAMALVERMLGGPKGAGLAVLNRVLAATVAAFAGLGVVEYLSHYASLLSTVWTGGPNTSGAVAQVAAAYSPAANQGVGLGSAIGLIFLALLVLVLVTLLYVEMVLRTALVLVVTTFIPLVAAMTIWPRLTGPALRLAEFLALLLMSKFVMVTAVYVGFTMMAYGAMPGGHGMIVGIAILLMAAISPGLLFQGVRLGEAHTANAVRGWVAAGVGAAAMVGWLGMTVVSLRGRKMRKSGRAARPAKADG
jgi:hypothetical protein